MVQLARDFSAPEQSLRDPSWFSEAGHTVGSSSSTTAHGRKERKTQRGLGKGCESSTGRALYCSWLPAEPVWAAPTKVRIVVRRLFRAAPLCVREFELL